MLDVGQAFPQFSLQDQDNRTVRLKDFVGRWLVIYSYPKDDTPGCTLEGRGFSAILPQFQDLEASVLGLSEDDTASHRAFCDKFGFSISLLSDPKGDLLGAAGVGQSDYKGVKYWNRNTYVIDPKGIVRKIYLDVKPEGHEKQVLEDLKALQV